MKRIWFGAGLLALLLILSIFTGNLMCGIWQHQAKNLSRAAELATDGDWAAADALLEEFAREWDRRQFLVAALFRHEEIDGISSLFAQLKVFSDALKIFFRNSKRIKQATDFSIKLAFGQIFPRLFKIFQNERKFIK